MTNFLNHSDSLIDSPAEKKPSPERTVAACSANTEEELGARLKAITEREEARLKKPDWLDSVVR